MNVGTDALRTFFVPLPNSSGLGKAGFAMAMTAFTISGHALIVDAPSMAVAKDGVPC